MVIKHYELKASQLREGNLLQIGSSTNYVLVADAKPETDGRIGIWIYDGDDQRAPGVRLRLNPDEPVSVSTASPMPVRLHADDWRTSWTLSGKPPAAPRMTSIAPTVATRPPAATNTPPTGHRWTDGVL